VCNCNCPTCYRPVRRPFGSNSFRLLRGDFWSPRTAIRGELDGHSLEYLLKRNLPLHVCLTDIEGSSNIDPQSIVSDIFPSCTGRPGQPWSPPSIGSNTGNSPVDTVRSTPSTPTNSLAFFLSHTLSPASLSTESAKQLCVLRRQSALQTPGFSPSTSIQSPEDTGLSPKTPLDVEEIPNQLQLSQSLDWQSNEAKKFDNQDIPSQPTTLGSFYEPQTPQKSFRSAGFASKIGSSSSFSGSSTKSPNYSPFDSGGLPSPVSKSEDRQVNYPQRGSPTLQGQFSQETIRQADHSTNQPAQERKQQCGKPKGQFLCAYCSRIFSTRSEFKYVSLN
jgi:hypothetical protein